MSGLRSAALITLTLWAAAIPSALAADLDPESAEWNGLAGFAALLRASAARVETPATLHLSALPPGSGLALLDPLSVESPRELRRFVQAGGRLLLAAEGPSLDVVLREFETRTVPPPSREAALGGHPALAVIEAREGGLFTSVSRLVVNRPVGLEAPTRLEPAARFEDGTGFAYHLKLGEGEVLMIGDASVLINAMLVAGDNGRFARNLATWLSAGGRAPVILARADAQVVGGLEAEVAPPGPPWRALNDALAQLGGGRALSKWALAAILALLLGGVVAGAGRLLDSSARAAPPHADLNVGARVTRQAAAARAHYLAQRGQPSSPREPNQEIRA